MNLIRELVTIAPDCECIKVTYTLEGEEPVTVEVEKNEIDNRYYFDVDSVQYRIAYSSLAFLWQVQNVIPPIAAECRLYLTTPCPFGTYTIEEGSIFESFIVEPCY
jgi:hypothetical protein